MPDALEFYSELGVPEVGGDVDAWGSTLVALHSAWDRALGGIVSIDVSSANVTLDTTQAQHHHIVVIGNPTNDRTITLPAKSRSYIVRHNLSTSFNVKIKTPVSISIDLRPFEQMLIYCDGSEIIAAGPPVRFDGGFANGTAGGTSIFFSRDSSRALGFRAPGSTSIGVGLGGTNDGIRFHGSNNAANPLIQLVSDPAQPNPYTTGFIAPSNTIGAAVAGGVEVFRWDGVRFYVGRSSPDAGNFGAFITTAGRIQIECDSQQAMDLARYSAGNIVRFHYGAPTNIVGAIAISNTATSYNTSSDRRIKNKIEDAPDLWAKLEALRVREFEFKVEPGRKWIGLIAQELREVFPGLVTGIPDGDLQRDGPMGVDYSKLAPVLLWAVQDLYRRMNGG